MRTIKLRLERAEKFSGQRPFAALTDEELDAKVKHLSAKLGLPLPDDAVKIYGSLGACIRVFRKAMENDSYAIKRDSTTET